MKLEEIYEQWKKDAEIDITELGNEAIKIAKLHHKYYQILSSERLLLKSQEAEMKKLKLDKYEFFTQGPNEETEEKGWKLPAKGLILKADIPMYMDADSDIIKLSLKIGLQQEKIELLESIIRTLMNRGYNVKAAIDFQKFISGG
jgi:hypothetical protein